MTVVLLFPLHFRLLFCMDNGGKQQNRVLCPSCSSCCSLLQALSTRDSFSGILLLFLCEHSVFSKVYKETVSRCKFSLYLYFLPISHLTYGFINLFVVVVFAKFYILAVSATTGITLSVSIFTYVQVSWLPYGFNSLMVKEKL